MSRWQRRSEAATTATAAASPSPSPSAPASVGIIGGGIAGLACARRLGELGVPAVLFDTGKRAPGGRASSRIWRGHPVDHAVQFAAATDARFGQAIEKTGVAKLWDGRRFGNLRAGKFAPSDDRVERWFGEGGFGSIVASLARDVDVRQDVWVSPSGGVRADRSGGYVVEAPGEGGRGKQGLKFEAVIIAHNGKCADRLTSRLPSKVNTLLRTNFAPSLPQRPQPGSGKFTLNQVYSLLLEVPEGLLPGGFDGAFVQDEPVLKWLSSNTAKLGRSKDAAPGTEAWTALSTPGFGKKHKAPQEFLEGTPKEKEVTKLMLEAIERATGVAAGSLQQAVKATKLQLWGAGLPINRWATPEGQDFVWDAEHKIGIAGDWLSSDAARASTVEASWLSGALLAEHLAGDGCTEDVGLAMGEDGGAFEPVEGDFGGAGSTASAWVLEQGSQGGAPGGKGGGKGRGKGQGKGQGKGKGQAPEKGGDCLRRPEEASGKGLKGKLSRPGKGGGGEESGAKAAPRWQRK